jgi:hypothetical protein
MLQRKEYRQILIELMCIDQQSKKKQVTKSQKDQSNYKHRVLVI